MYRIMQLCIQQIIIKNNQKYSCHKYDTIRSFSTAVHGMMNSPLTIQSETKVVTYEINKIKYSLIYSKLEIICFTVGYFPQYHHKFIE